MDGLYLSFQIKQAEEEPKQETTEQGIVVPDIQCPLSQERLATLQQQVNPTTESSSFGRDIFLCALEITLG